MHPETDDPELTALASTLAALAPAPASWNRDRLLFQAGQAAASRCHWPWQLATAVLAVLAVGLGLVARPGPAPLPIEQPVATHRMEPTPPASNSTAKPPIPPEEPMPLASEETEVQPAPLSSFRLEQVALRWGVEALPDSLAGPAPRLPREPDRPFDARRMREFLETQTP